MTKATTTLVTALGLLVAGVVTTSPVAATPLATLKATIVSDPPAGLQLVDHKGSWKERYFDRDDDYRRYDDYRDGYRYKGKHLKKKKKRKIFKRGYRLGFEDGYNEGYYDGRHDERRYSRRHRLGHYRYSSRGAYYRGGGYYRGGFIELPGIRFRY